MIRRTLLTAVLAVALMAGVASPDPLTSAFDGIRGVVSGLLESPESLAGAQKKAATKADKAIGKDSTTIKKDISTGKKVNKMEKKFPENSAVLEALDGMVMGLRGALQTRFDEVQANVDLLPAAKPADQARKLIGKAGESLSAASEAETRKDKLKFLGKANSKTEAAQKKVDKANKGGGGGGGGGKFKCPNLPALGAGESGTITIDGSTKNLGGISSSIFTQDNVDNLFVVLYFCDERAQDYRELQLTVPSADVGEYLVTPFSDTASAFLLRDPRPDVFGQLLGGTINITMRENGKVGGNFTNGIEGSPPVSADFVVDDPF